MHFFIHTTVNMASMFEKDWYRIRIVNLYGYAANGRKINKRGNVLCNISTCEGKLQIIISNVLVSKQLIRMGNVSEITFREFELAENASNFDERFIKSYDENRDKGYILKLMLNTLTNYTRNIIIYHFLSKNMKIKKCQKLVCNL